LNYTRPWRILLVDINMPAEPRTEPKQPKLRQF